MFLESKRSHHVVMFSCEKFRAINDMLILTYVSPFGFFFCYDINYNINLEWVCFFLKSRIVLIKLLVQDLVLFSFFCILS